MVSDVGHLPHLPPLLYHISHDVTWVSLVTLLLRNLPSNSLEPCLVGGSSDPHGTLSTPTPFRTRDPQSSYRHTTRHKGEVND